MRLVASVWCDYCGAELHVAVTQKSGRALVSRGEVVLTIQPFAKVLPRSFGSKLMCAECCYQRGASS